MTNYSPGIELMSEARKEQIEKGFDVDHDIDCNHEVEDLLTIAACYVSAASDMASGIEFDWPHPFWPHDTGIPATKLDTAQEMAVRGGAWLAAALDLQETLTR